MYKILIFIIISNVEAFWLENVAMYFTLENLRFYLGVIKLPTLFSMNP